jgi:hypothetical protein
MRLRDLGVGGFVYDYEKETGLMCALHEHTRMIVRVFWRTP